MAEIAAAIIHQDLGQAASYEPLRNQLAGAATEVATDGGEFAAAVLDQALASLGAASVALWLTGADGSLALLGEAGLGPAEASRWQRLPPQMDCPAQRVGRGGPDLWWPAGGPAGDVTPLLGRWPDGARAVVALRDRGPSLLGVMEVCWPRPRTGFPDALRQQVTDLAKSCAQLLSTRIAHGELAMVRSRPALRGLLDGLLETVMVASALRDTDGHVTDFRIEYASETFRDSAWPERRRARRADPAGDVPDRRDGRRCIQPRGAGPGHRPGAAS